MADSKLSALPALAATPAGTDEVYIRDISEPAADQSKRITVTNLLGSVHAESHTHVSHTGITATDHHSNANDHASSHTHASHTGIGATDHHSNANDHAQDSDIVVASFFVENPVATDDQAFHRVPFAATLLQVDYLCVGGTNWVGQVEEADTNGLNGVATQAADTTATAGTNVQVTSFSNSSLASGAYLKLRSTSISGTPTSLVVTVQYRKA